MIKPICVLGDGSWGTAIATVLAANGNTVHLWCNNQSVADSVAKHHTNDRFLPGVTLDERIIPFTDLGKALEDVGLVFEAIPVKYMRSVLEKAVPYYKKNQIWVVLSKGIENGSLLFPTQVIEEIFGPSCTSAVMVGPSFAHEVVKKQLTRVLLCAPDIVEQTIISLCQNSFFKITYSTDLIGAQVCSAFKNVIALAVGMLEGACLGVNTRALAITRGLQEMKLLTEACGGRVETVYGLAGVGDLVLTGTSHLSKNVKVGILFGKGQSLKDIQSESGCIPEGLNTVGSIKQLMKQKGLTLPLSQAVCNIIFEGASIQGLITIL